MRYPILAACAAFLAGAAGLHAGTDSRIVDRSVQSANQRMGGFYVSVQGGADFSNNIHDTIGGVGTGPDIRSATLALGGIKGGYAWEGIPLISDMWAWVPKGFTTRLELEADWSGDHRSLGPVGFHEDNAIVLFNQTVGYHLGKVEPYVGGGIGFINSWVRAPGLGNSSDISLAYGPLAGLRYDIAPHWQAYAEYKFLRSDDKSYSGGGATIDTHHGGDQIATAGLTYLFF